MKLQTEQATCPQTPHTIGQLQKQTQNILIRDYIIKNHSFDAQCYHPQIKSQMAYPVHDTLNGLICQNMLKVMPSVSC